jgi:hypothetical protein
MRRMEDMKKEGLRRRELGPDWDPGWASVSAVLDLRVLTPESE